MIKETARIALLGVAGAAMILGIMVPAVSASTHAAPATVRHLGGCRARGDFAICVAGGSVNHPSSIHVHVTANPAQRVTGSWSVVCSRGFGAGSKSGNFHGRAGATSHPLTVPVKMPYKHPDNCTASADAQLSSHGRLHVWITARN
jgi:hypothetical protein